MARYVKDLPIVDAPEVAFGKVQQYLLAQKYEFLVRDGEQVFQKGKGVWVAARFVKVTWFPTVVRVEAWIDAMGDEQGLDGFVGAAAKQPLKKDVEQVEMLLSAAGEGFVLQIPEQTCAACGSQIPAGANFCPRCRTPVGAPTGAPQAAPARQLPPNLTKKEYYKSYTSESFRKNLKIVAICGYVLCGIIGVTVFVSPLVLIDLILYLSLTLGMHMGKSKGCAVGILVLSALTGVINLFTYGALSGWGWIAMGVIAVILFTNEDKRYKKLTGR